MLNALRKESFLRFQAGPSSGPPVPRRGVRRLALGLMLRGIALAALVALPFMLFVRVSVYAYADGGLPTWPAIGSGITVTVFVVAAYAMFISKRLTGRIRARVMLQRIALPLVLLYSGYGLWHLSSMNAKTARVRAHYTALHPTLRIALGTILLVDRDLVLTDVRRTQSDYEAMGLAPREASLHYEQRDGYVHAVDLRTAGRGKIRNGLMALYFRVMGFKTLRHVGTADHLHVNLAGRSGR